MAVIEHHDLVGYRNKRVSIDENVYSLQRAGFTCFLVKGMDYSNRNGDGQKEFVVRGTYKGGHFSGDGFNFEVEEWYALDQTLRSIFYFTYEGGGLIIDTSTEDGTYEILDANRDGFYEMEVPPKPDEMISLEEFLRASN